MKKIIGGVFCVLLIFSFSACGKSESVKSVEDLISSIDSVVSLDSGDVIVSAESAYGELSEKEQNKVENYASLVNARVQYDLCVAIHDYDDAVITYNDVVGAYNAVASEANDANTNFQAFLDAISESGVYQEIAYDQTTIEVLQEATSNAALLIQENIEGLTEKNLYVEEDITELTNDEINEMSTFISSEADSISTEASSVAAQTEQIEVPDYESLEAEIQVKWDAALESIAIQNQITQPSEDFVISKLYTIDDIDSVQAATEDNDPNGQLNKSKGYTAAVFFSVPTIDSSLLYGNSVLERGTDGGGCIEVYTCVEDAESRNTYLAAFDGTVFASGSHTVLGTMVIRTSNYLTASEQSALEAKIIEAMTTLE